MNIRKLTHFELSEARKRGDITSMQLEEEITRRSAFSLSGILSRFVAQQNADVFGAPEGNDGRHA